MSGEQPIRVLLIEDNPGDARLIQEGLKEAERTSLERVRFDLQWTSRLSHAEALLHKDQSLALGVILLDLTLPDSSGMETFDRVRAAAPQAPIVVISGMVDDRLASQAVRQGAQDYLVKGDVDGALIGRSVRYAMARRQAELDREQIIREQAARSDAEALARENERLYRAAEEAVRIRDEFLSVAAHELKTPLTSLRGMAQLALRRYQREGTLDPRRTQEALQVIEQQSGKLARLVSQLLDVSRIEAGRLSIEPELTDMGSLAESAAAMVRNTARNHTIVVDAPAEEQIWAMVDPLRMEQVLTNLIDNAIKFSPDGGLITVEVRRPGAGEILLAVQDRGVGIPEASRQGLFERFYQAHAFRSPNGDSTMAGLGLGLYISRQIVELHGGRIDARFPKEGGTRIEVSIPHRLSDRAADGDAPVGSEQPSPSVAK